MTRMLISSCSLLMHCVTRKIKCYDAMNNKEFSVWASYTKYKIWVTHNKREMINPMLSQRLSEYAEGLLLMQN